MPVLLKNKTYSWLQSIGVFRNDPIKTQSQQFYEVPYDEEIYLQNGYLIGIALRKFVKAYSDQYQQLLKVRKIATLKTSQNWQIIQPFLNKIGCELNTRSYQEQGDQIQISIQQIGQILETLHQEYGPQEERQVKIAKKARVNFVDIYNFSPNKPMDTAQNSLELMCILLVKNLQISLGDALGLLMNKSKFLKQLIEDGSIKDDYQKVKILYQNVTASWPIINQFLQSNPKDTQKFLQGLSHGVLSQNNQIIHLTLNLLSYVTDQQWFLKYGYYKLLSSSHIQSFYFTIQRISPNYQKILNQNIHITIQNKIQLYTILYNLLKTVPKTIYAKQVFTHLPITYYYQQCYKVLNIQQIDDQPPKIVIRAMQLLAKLITTYPQKIPNNYLKNIFESFKYNDNRGYENNYFIAGLLFQVLQGLMMKQSHHLQNFFKIAMRYLKDTTGQLKHWIIDNLRYLYQKMGKSFPIGCLLTMYTLDNVGQADQYQLFDLICQDTNNLTPQQCTLTLSYIIKYIQTQQHCKCFMLLLRKFLAHHPNASSHWASQFCLTLLPKMQKIHIPMFNAGQINILNPKPPIKNKVVNSIGVKRKQMMKLGEYQLGRTILDIFSQINDKKFLAYYVGILGHTIQGIEKEIGHKKKQLVNLLKNLRKKAKKRLDQLPQTQPMNQIVKSIMQNRSSSMSRSPGQTTPLKHTNIPPHLSQSKFFESYSRILTEPANNSRITEEQDQDNQFIPEDYQNQLSNKIDKYKQQNKNGIDNQSKAKQFNPLLQFNDQVELDQQNKDWDGTIIENNMLQQNQIAYINVMKQKYKKMLQFCSELYRNSQKQSKNLQKVIQTFLNQADLKNIIKYQKAEQMILKLKTHYSNPHELIQNFLVQSSFLAFNFKQNRRVSVTCVSSLFSLLHENLQKKYPQYNSDNFKKNKDGKQLSKNLKYQFAISNKLNEWNRYKDKNIKHFENYSICFQILSQLCFNKLKLNLVQPLSKQTNQIISSKNQQINLQNSPKISIYPPPLLPHQDQNQQQYEQLQKQLSQIQIGEPNQQNNFRVKKQKKIKNNQKLKTQGTSLPKNIKEIDQQLQDSHTVALNKKDSVDHKELRSKIAQRLQILQKDLKKNNKSQQKYDN